MNRTKPKSIFCSKSEFCEKVSSKPIDSFVPNQAMKLKELVSRFERGQRLNVHSNFYPGSNFESMTDEEALWQIQHESMDTEDFPPIDVHDVSDVQRLQEENDVRKRDFIRRQNSPAKQEDLPAKSPSENESEK